MRNKSRAIATKSFAANSTAQYFGNPPPIIADVELIASVSGVAIWAGADKSGQYDREIEWVGAGNRDVFPRVGRGARVFGGVGGPSFLLRYGALSATLHLYPYICANRRLVGDSWRGQ